MLMKAKTEAARGICLTTGVLTDLARLAGTPEERAAALARQELLTPIAKAWSTDVGVEVASLGVQVHGGMGFIEETGAAQHYRDARIAPIYEGTNGIQAIDLVGRKVRMADGGVMRGLCAEMALTADLLTETAALAPVGKRLAAGVAALERATDWILANGGAPQPERGHALSETGRRRGRRLGPGPPSSGRRGLRRPLVAGQGGAGPGLRQPGAGPGRRPGGRTDRGRRGSGGHFGRRPGLLNPAERIL